MSTALSLRSSYRTALVGQATRVRLQAAKLLGAAGFMMSEADAPGVVIVLAAAGTEVERGREIRELVDAYPDGSVLAIVPSDAPNVSLRRALVAGARGIVLADQLATALVPTAYALLAGQLAVPMALSRQIAPSPLSYRERQILGLVVEGLTNREIADRLYLAESTIKTHISSIFRKIDARSRAEAITRVRDPESGIGQGVLALVEPAAPDGA